MSLDLREMFGLHVSLRILSLQVMLSDGMLRQEDGVLVCAVQYVSH